MLEVNNLVLNYGKKPVLRGINLQASEGKITAILSPNGNGKTSFMHSLLGYVKITEGLVYLNKTSRNENYKTDILSLSVRDRARYMSFIPQFIPQNLSYSVFEFVLLGSSVHIKWYEYPGLEWKSRAREVLEELGIYHLRDRAMNEISGGERQMAFLARSILQDSRVLLLDEPTAWLDLKNQALFFSTLKKNIKDRELIVLMNIHDIHAIAAYADYLYLLKNGHNLASGTPKETLNSTLLTELYDIPIDTFFNSKGVFSLFVCPPSKSSI